MSAAILFVLACEHGQEVDIAFLLEHVDAARKPCQSHHRDYEPNLYHRAHRVAAVIVTAGRGAGRYRAGAGGRRPQAKPTAKVWASVRDWVTLRP